MTRDLTLVQPQSSEQLYERLLAGVYIELMSRGQQDAARLIASCRIVAVDEETAWGLSALAIKINCPFATRDALRRPAMEQIVKTAFDECVAHGEKVHSLAFRAELPEVPANWRELAASSLATLNQAVGQAQTIAYQGNFYRSEGEVAIAQALDRAGATFLANGRIRLDTYQGRVNREPDFLIAYDGVWGILEVDSALRQEASGAADDQERDRLFRHARIRVVERYDVRRCEREPDAVVEEFLDRLRQSLMSMSISSPLDRQAPWAP